MPLAAMRLVGESNSAIVPLSRTRTLAEEKKWSGLHQLSAGPDRPAVPFWDPLRPCRDMPVLPLRATHPAQPLGHMCTFARLVILAAPFALLADETASGIKHKVPIHLCSSGPPKTFPNEPFPQPGSQDCAQGATGLCAGPCASPPALCRLTKAHGRKLGCSEA